MAFQKFLMNMNNLDIYDRKICKYEILAEISLHSKKSKKKTIKLLCSRLLARHSKIEDCYKEDILTNKSLENNDVIDVLNEHHSKEQEIDNDYNNGPLLNDDNVEDESHKLNVKWYEYWEKNGEHFVNDTWIKQYGSCILDDLPMDPEELYKSHREQQYHVLYWKFIKEMNYIPPEIEDHTRTSIEMKECDSNHSEELDDIDDISNFEFLYKYKHFNEANSKLTRVYRALSIMGFIYEDQNIFESGFVQYLKSNLIKSTRHLNVYNFKKKMNLLKTTSKNKLKSNEVNDQTDEQGEFSIINNMSISNHIGCIKNKKLKKIEKWKEYKDKELSEELERLGYSYFRNDPKLLKYWKRRYVLFSKFNEGIQLDKESWYSVTPEIISKHIAERCSCYLLVDPFCGAGGNIIQFAKTCELVIAIDNDPKKIEIARHNAELYGVADRIQFIIGDFFALAPTLKADVIFLSPPWGGPDLMTLEEYKLSYIMPENGGGENLINVAKQVSSNIALHLPKNTNIFDCINSAYDSYVEVQQNMLNSRYNSLTIYYSELYGLCDEDTNTYYDN